MKADNAHTLELFFFFLNEVEYLNVFPVIAANAGEGRSMEFSPLQLLRRHLLWTSRNCIVCLVKGEETQTSRAKEPLPSDLLLNYLC